MFGLLGGWLDGWVGGWMGGWLVGWLVCWMVGIFDLEWSLFVFYIKFCHVVYTHISSLPDSG